MRKNLKKWLSFLLVALILTVGISQPCGAAISTQTLKYDNGDVYKGKVEDYYLDIDDYEGDEELYAELVSKQGKGTYYCKNGTVIRGSWNQNYLSGKATVTYFNGEKFTGSFSRDKRNGTGTYKFKNGDKFTGKWKNDKMNGKGTYTWKNKWYVKGTWKNGKLNGDATLKIKNYIYSIKVSNGTLKKIYSKREG